MTNNYLEQLVAEWYEFRGFFVRRNILVGKRPSGGYECELDIVAFHPVKRELVHVEPSMDANSWAVRERRFKKKFDAGRRYIPGLFTGLDIPSEIEQIALLGFGSDVNHPTLGGGLVITIEQLLKEIFAYLKDRKIPSSAISENFILLRAYQFVSNFPHVVAKREK